MAGKTRKAYWGSASPMEKVNVAMISGKPKNGRPRRIGMMLRNQCGGSSGQHVVLGLGGRSDDIRKAQSIRNKIT